MEEVVTQSIGAIDLISSGFVVWLTGLASGITLRYLRNIVTTASN
ncbi:hypothetical protein [Vibrio parahaemolyticus]|nr:hypothetical protein [Vibrio parahaemolyticus]MCR9692913.1 hypothetical protein [Vibrio parahaemolyticus]MCR9760907.1 hypothetical protein [Vibrio parahaemolyticus]MCR9811783.1 hypothetical protein [Vibrio parahaemolyticus]MCR9930161.1 hypothetical protein [Vibrio parahaemolyticus]